METKKQKQYGAPAVIYEAVLVAHAETSETQTGEACCGLPTGDLLDSILGK